MRTFKFLAAAALLLLAVSALPLAAQTSTTPATPPRGQTPASPAERRGRQQPCWQQAGVSQATVQKRREIEQNTRTQMEAVCNDSSLKPEQKREKIRQIREEGRKQSEALMTPDQVEKLKACREQRGGHEPGEGGEGEGMHRGGRGGEGPCGEMPAGRKGAGGKPAPPSDEDQH